MGWQISPDKNRAIIGSLRRRSSWKGIEELKSDIGSIFKVWIKILMDGNLGPVIVKCQIYVHMFLFFSY